MTFPPVVSLASTTDNSMSVGDSSDMSQNNSPVLLGLSLHLSSYHSNVTSIKCRFSGIVFLTSSAKISCFQLSPWHSLPGNILDEKDALMICQNCV